MGGYCPEYRRLVARMRGYHSPVKLLSDLPVSSILPVVVSCSQMDYGITISAHLLGKELHHAAGLGHSQGGEGVNLVLSPLWFVSH